MSDDGEIDIESDDDEYDLQNPDGPFPSQAEKRAHHNALERKRRDHIKDSFSSLRDCVPALNGEKASRAQILKKAADYIQIMRRKNHSHQQDIDDLRSQNGLLEVQIRNLEKAKATGNFNVEASSLIINAKGDSISAFDGGSGSDSSDSVSTLHKRRKRMKSSNNSSTSSNTT